MDRAARRLLTVIPNDGTVLSIKLRGAVLVADTEEPDQWPLDLLESALADLPEHLRTAGRTMALRVEAALLRGGHIDRYSRLERDHHVRSRSR